MSVSLFSSLPTWPEGRSTYPGGGGPIDLAASSDDQFLYVESGGTGTVDEFRVNSDGALVAIGVVAAAHGLEGIVAI